MPNYIFKKELEFLEEMVELRQDENEKVILYQYINKNNECVKKKDTCWKGSPPAKLNLGQLSIKISLKRNKIK